MCTPDKIFKGHQSNRNNNDQYYGNGHDDEDIVYYVSHKRAMLPYRWSSELLIQFPFITRRPLIAIAAQILRIQSQHLATIGALDRLVLDHFGAEWTGFHW